MSNETDTGNSNLENFDSGTFIMKAYDELEKSMSFLPNLSEVEEKYDTIEYFFSEVISNFTDEISSNVLTLQSKLNSELLIDSYFSILFEKINNIRQNYLNKKWPVVISHKMIAEYKDLPDSPEYLELKEQFLKEQKWILENILGQVNSIKHDLLIKKLEEAEVMEVKPLNEISLTERLIIIHCLQQNKLFIREDQQYNQAKILSLISTIFQKDISSVKTAYQNSKKYLEGSAEKFTKQQKEAALKSLNNALPSIEALSNDNLTEIISKRIQELEFSNN